MNEDDVSAVDGAVSLEDLRIKAEVRGRLFGRASAPLTIGRFRLQRKIGEGGMAAVYLAEDPELERQVAVKILGSRRFADPSRVHRLQREAKLLARLSHPNIVHLYEVGRDGEVDFVAMEYVRGRTLAQWQAEGTRSAAEILAVYRQAGEGLAAAHREGIVHRDFKPDNVLVCEHGRARVLDFGLAVSAGTLLTAADEAPASGDQGRLTVTGAIMGTPAYMAPEQYRGEAVDDRTDQFSFCVALYEALYGERPFEGTTAASLRHAVLHGQRRRGPSPLPTSRRVYRALRRGTAVDPDERWPTMTALLDVLESPRSRGRGLLIASAAALLAGGAIVGVVSSRPPRESSPASTGGTDPAPAAAPDPPASAPRWIIHSQRLTNHPQRRVLSARLDPRGDTLMFEADGAYYLRPLEGGVPRRLELGELNAASVDFLPGGAGFVVSALDGLWSVPRDGAPARLFDDTPVFDEIFTSSTGLVMGWSGKSLWVGDLDTRRVVLHRQMSGEIEHASWKSDGSRLAVSMFSVTKDEIELVLVDPRRGHTEVFARGPYAGHATMWTGDALIVANTITSGASGTLHCLRPSSEPGGAPWIESEPLSLPGYLSPFAITPRGDLVGVVLERHHDVGVLDLRGSAPGYLKLLGAPSNSANWSPVWRDDDRLLVMTDRFLRPLPVQYDLRRDELTTFDDVPPQLRWAAVEDGVVFLSEPDEGEPPGVYVADFTLRSPRRLTVSLPGEYSINDISCTRARSCVLVGDYGSERWLFALDVDAETLESRGPCPDGAVCQRGAWSLSADARELLFVGGQRLRVSRYDAVSRARISDIFEVVDPGRIVQSVAAWSDGYLVTTMSSHDEPGRPAPYAIEHVRPGRPPRRLWSAERGPWAFAPSPSPSGARVAVTTMNFSSDVWRLEGGGRCPSPPSASPRADTSALRPRASVESGARRGSSATGDSPE